VAVSDPPLKTTAASAAPVTAAVARTAITQFVRTTLECFFAMNRSLWAGA
jgi:hypothetical protein